MAEHVFENTMCYTYTTTQDEIVISTAPNKIVQSNNFIQKNVQCCLSQPSEVVVIHYIDNDTHIHLAK
jgi:hypothetical protein